MVVLLIARPNLALSTDVASLDGGVAWLGRVDDAAGPDVEFQIRELPDLELATTTYPWPWAMKERARLGCVVLDDGNADAAGPEWSCASRSSL